MKSSNRWTVFAVCSGLYVMSMIYRSSPVVIARELSLDLGLRAEDLGLLSAMFFYVFGVVQLPLGFSLDWLKPRRTMICLNLIGVAGAVLFSLAHGMTAGTLGRALLGMGMSANVIGSLTLFTRWFSPAQFTTVSGLIFAMGALGGLLATSPLRLLVDAAGWRFAYQGLAGLNLVLVVLFILLVRDAPEGAEQPGGVPPSPREILRTFRKLAGDLSYLAVSAMSGMRYGVYGAIQSLWAGPYLMIHLGLPVLVAANLLLLLNVGFIIGGPAAGLVNDVYCNRPKWIMLVSLVVMAACMFALAVYPGPVMLPLLGSILFLFGFFGGFAPLTFSHIRLILPVEMVGRSFAGANFCAMFGGGLFLQGLGWLVGGSGAGLESGGAPYRMILLICSGFLVLGTLLYGFTRETLAMSAAMGAKNDGGRG